MSEKIIDLPKNYKPSEKEEYMCDKHREYFRCKLIEWKETLLNESSDTLKHLKKENLNEPDITDRASIECEVSIELRTRDRYRKLIDKIDAALNRIKRNKYGFCVQTDDPIGLKRLEVRPIATLSILAQEEHERVERVYNDE